MPGYSIMVDTSKCTACRGCQIACKQWNVLPGTETRNLGTHQNPPDFNFNTYKVVRFSEGSQPDGKAFWYFMTDQCRHCLSPGCMATVENGEIIQDEKTGAVLYTPKTKDLDFNAVREGCPFDVPRQDEKSKLIAKCTLCFDRITNNMIPACVKSCPTGAMTFGPREEILELVGKTVDGLKKKFPDAKAVNADEVRVIYVVTDDPAKYYKYMAGR